MTVASTYQVLSSKRTLNFRNISLKSGPSNYLDMYLSNLAYLFSMRVEVLELGINTPGPSGFIFDFFACNGLTLYRTTDQNI